MVASSSIIFAAACAAVAWAGWCRLVRVDTSVHWPVRLAFWALTVCALAAAAHALVWGYQPGWPSAALASAMALVLSVTSAAWRGGVPGAYRRDELEARP